MIDYLDEFENVIFDNVVIHKVKEYSINKNDIDTHYKIGELMIKNKINTRKKIEQKANKITASLEICVPVEELLISLKFYTLINQGLIKNYNVKWDHYLLLMNLNDINEMNIKIEEII